MNFDRAAPIYDATRALPPDVLDRIVEFILSKTGAERGAQFLDIGVGTGRFAIPLLQCGYQVTGVDISEEMMQRLRDKVGPHPHLSLRTASAQSLPFADDTFDAAMAMQVLHLVAEWRQALAEARRVLKPGGYVVLGSGHGMPGPARDIRQQWRDLVREQGGELPTTLGASDDARAALAEMGAQSTVSEVIQWTKDIAPLVILEAIRSHTFSDSWHVPDDVMDRVQRRLNAWASDRYGDLETPVPSTFGIAMTICSVPGPDL